MTRSINLGQARKPSELDLGYINSIHIDVPAVLRRAKDLPARRPFKGQSQIDVHLRAIECIDLTDLTGNCTEERVKRLCAKALNPVEQSTLDKLGKSPVTVAAVCIYDRFIETAFKSLGDRIPVAAVSADFPNGHAPMDVKLLEIKLSIEAGAKEIDIVISRQLAQREMWQELYEEISQFRAVCGEQAHLKTILAVGDIGDYEKVAKASAVAIMAGSDFIKTSTGFEKVNATLPYGLVMVRQIREWMSDHPNDYVGFKPAGGIKTAKDAQAWFAMMLDELGDPWTRPELFRIGASSLVNDLERQLYHAAFGRYAATRNIPIG